MRGRLVVLVASLSSLVVGLADRDARADQIASAEALALASTAPAPQRIDLQPKKHHKPRTFIQRWPTLPQQTHSLSMEDRLDDTISEYTNELGAKLDHVSFHLVEMQFDARAMRAHIKLGGGDRYLTFGLDGDVHFTDGMAQIHARLDLGIGTHAISIPLPAFEMVPQSYNGDRYVELRIPLLERRW